MRCLLIACAAAFLLAPPLAGQAADPASLQWGTPPALFPPGAQMALISGDPVKPVLLTALLSMPDGYRIPPHSHPTDELVEVKQGVFLVPDDHLDQDHGSLHHALRETE